ncbi:MAG: cupredoxin domain-containing protein [Bdellovibrionales bacterium]|nr:cupredoxin domain-containing protein [Bdellovibrionales bacterium]
MTKSHFILFLLNLLIFATSLEASQYSLETKNGYFFPEVIEIPANEKVILLVKNTGSEAEEFESLELNREKIVLPGKTIKVKLGPLKPGEYSFFGEFHPNTANGKILVK